MSTPTTAPYGSWRSPITTDLIVTGSLRLGQICLDGSDVYWSEGRPTDAGRSVVVQWQPPDQVQDYSAADFNVRTTVHEYGGGAYLVQDGILYFSHFNDQRLYRQRSGEAPTPLTPEANRALRYADACWDPYRQRLILVREDARDPQREPINTLVSLDLSPEAPASEGSCLVDGHDFVSSPCLSPDGSQLAWLSWDHPNMPWDSTQLWVAAVAADGSLGEPQLVAGGPEESIFQPQWSPDGTLHFISDRTNWWNLYRWHTGSVQALCPKAAEFGLPQWVFGMSTYGFIEAARLLCTYVENGQSQLAILDTSDPGSPQLERLAPLYTSFGGLRVNAEQAVFVAGSPTEPAAVVRLDLRTREFTILRQSSEVEVDPGYLSLPVSIDFPTTNGLTAYGLYYPPQNRDVIASTTDKPPLLVKSHGGPTAATAATFNLRIQYWTSRGFAVLDVNYGGSTGYGRDYRQRLRYQWGVVDVDDCVNGAQFLVQQGAVDPNRLAIDGSSAGGYTTLAALTFRDVFKAGASYYGVSDLEALVRDTHKFESRYLDRLIGPYPEQQNLYRERSPIHFTHQLSCPVIFFQGLEDKIVPPNQAETMVEVLKSKNLPVAYIAFEGEQHGFRRAETIKQALDSEFYFYARVFGFEPADPLPPIPISNLGNPV